MAIQIFNDLSVIRIVNSETAPLLLHKWAVKTVDIASGDTVRINIGEGALRHIYLNFADVASPVVKNAQELQAFIRACLDSHFNNQLDTNAKLDILENSLQDVLSALSANGSGSVATSPLKDPKRIDESKPNIVYRGYSNIGVEPSAKLWAIEKVTRNGDVFIYEWAEGSNTFQQAWDQRYTLRYLPLS